MKQLSDFLDSNGLICVRWPNGFLEGGDTCANESSYWYCRNRLNMARYPTDRLKTFEEVMASLEVEPGVFVRHPDKTMWYSDHDRLSRDQATALICALSQWGKIGPLVRLFMSHAKHLFLFAWNTRRNGAFSSFQKQLTNDWRQHPDIANLSPVFLESDTRYALYEFPSKPGLKFKYDYRWKMPDFTGPEFLGLWIRAFRLWFLWPLLLICDLETLIGSVLKAKFGGDDRNHFMVIDHAMEVMPTPVMWLAQKIYKKYSPIEERFRDCWERNPESPPLHDLMIGVLKDWE